MKKIAFGILTLSLVLLSCNEEEKKTSPLLKLPPKALKEELIKINKEFVENESMMIDEYVDSSAYEFEESGTGLRIAIYKKGGKDTAKAGMLAVVKYKISDLQGNLIYQSDKGETQSFLIGKDNVEQGLHEGIQKMTVGSKAIIVLPSHLAHGLSGDNAEIPPQTALVYDIELVELKKHIDENHKGLSSLKI